MYPSKGSGAYGQQSYSGQQAYGQKPGAGDVGAKHAMTSRQSMMGAASEVDMSGYRTYSAPGAQYGGPYAAVYSSAALSSGHQHVGGVGGKGDPSSGIHGQYPAALPESAKLTSGALGSNLGMKSDDYVSASNRGYSQKEEPFPAAKVSEYTSTDRRHSGDQAAYLGRELQNDPARRYADSVTISQHQVDMHDRMDQATLIREHQILRAAQSLQSSSDIRRAEYLAARAAPIHRGSQEFSLYGGRMDVDPRSLPILGSTPYDNQLAPVLGGALRRNVDELLHMQGSSSAAYGVGFPPGRDYVAGKGLHVSSLESDYQASSRGHPSLVADERKDDRSAYRREFERGEGHRRELIRAKEKDREREERERQRERERERERRDREKERDRRRSLDARRERTPPRCTKDLPLPPRRSSPRRTSPRRASPHREAVHRHRSPVKERKREYTCKVSPFCLVDAERDYLSLNKRYPRLSISPECSKVVLHWPKQSLHLSLHTPVSFEHEYVELDSKGEALILSGDMSSLKHGNTVWNAKVFLLSGMTADALNDMVSYKSSDDKIIHFNNIIRFAIIMKDNSFMAIGGPWNATIDGGDPLVDDSSLIQTARRYLRDITELDLQNCQHWNRFLEVCSEPSNHQQSFSAIISFVKVCSEPSNHQQSFSRTFSGALTSP